MVSNLKFLAWLINQYIFYKICMLWFFCLPVWKPDNTICGNSSKLTNSMKKTLINVLLNMMVHTMLFSIKLLAHNEKGCHSISLVNHLSKTWLFLVFLVFKLKSIAKCGNFSKENFVTILHIF